MKLYKIDSLLVQKAYKEDKTVALVTKELLEQTHMSRQTFNGLRRVEMSNKTRLSVHLLALVKFFGCGIDGIVNQEIISATPETDAK